MTIAPDTPRSKVQSNIDRTGRNHLEERSRLRLRINALAPLRSILLIEDIVFDAEVLASSLRLVFGQDTRIVHVRNLPDARTAISQAMPDLAFLDDRLGHAVSAEVGLEALRRAGYDRPVIIVSGLLTRARKTELCRLGVADVVHKDDFDTARLSEAILRAFEIRAAD